MRLLPTKTPRRQRTGFSLIELLLVLALMVVIAGFAILALEGSLLRTRLEEGAQRIRTAWCDARLHTISAGEQSAFTCLIGGRDFRLSSCNDLCAPVDGGISIQEEENDGSLSGELPEGIVFRSLRAAPQSAATQSQEATPLGDGQWSPPVVFAPDGSSYDAVVVIEDESGKRIEITLRGLTCTATERRVAAGSEQPQ